MSSRAIITKGKLLLLEKITLAGQQFTILDEKLQVCKGARTGIWVLNRFHQSNKDGHIMIPFTESTERTKAILIHENFAVLTDIEIKPEQYQFKCTFLYNKEAMLMGNKMKILLQPRLYLNSVLANLAVIKDQVVKIEMRTDQDIPITQSFDKITLDAKEEIEIEIAIPAKLKSMNIKIAGAIKPMRGDKDIPIEANHHIQVKDFENENIFFSLFLKNTEQGYEVYILGKNGEPKCDVKMQIEMQRKYITKNVVANLITDKNGKVSLGKLENVLLLKAVGNWEKWGNFHTIEET